MTDDSCGRSNHIVCEGKMSGSLPAIFDRRTIIEDIFFSYALYSQAIFPDNVIKSCRRQGDSRALSVSECHK